MKFVVCMVALLSLVVATTAVNTARRGTVRSYDPYTVHPAELPRFRESAQEQDSVEFHAAMMMRVQNNRCPSGNNFLKCPFSTGTCCGQAGFAQACCPTGYGCRQAGSGWRCSAGSADTQHQAPSRPVTTISPTIVIGASSGASTSGSSAYPSPAASTAASPSSVAMPSMASSVSANPSADPSSTYASANPNGSGSGSSSDSNDGYKAKQNIIIVKNINVLTKGVAPASSIAPSDTTNNQ